MASDKVLKVNNDTWQKDVLDSELPVLVDFWAPWCGPCRLLTPIVERLADQFDGRVKIAKLNVDEATEVAARYGISGLPQILVFKGGEARQKVVGLTSEAELAKMLNLVLDAKPV
jgi:thioredoxin 1